MADTKPAGFLSKMAETGRRWLKRGDHAQDISEFDYGWGYDGVTVSMLLGSGKRQARMRQSIYQKWHYMAGDPVVAAALRLHVTQALGGHETSGDVVFIELEPGIKETDPVAEIVKELQDHIAPILNRVAHQIAFNGAAFGDAYARVYSKDKVGVQDLYTDEMVYSPMVQAYERGNRTVGFIVSTGSKFQEKLTIVQMARMKMQRMLYVPQMRVIEKSVRMALAEDDVDKQPFLPSLVGGSFLEAAEEPYDNMSAALTGLVGQRITSAVDEVIVAANYDGMTLDQRKDLGDSLKEMLLASKKRAEDAMKEGRIPLGRHYHLVPKYSDKQNLEMLPVQGAAGTTGTVSVEDIMLHAKMLGGALGIDISMLGFADLLSGGLGDGGFFRVSAQAAERSRLLRTALTDFFNNVIDIHTLKKYGWVFESGKRPYKINFYGSISALETEKQKNREVNMNAGTVLAQIMAQLRDLGLPEDVNREFLSKMMDVDEDLAKMLARGLKNAKPPQQDGFGGGGFGGGGGGDFGGGEFGGPGGPDDEPADGEPEQGKPAEGKQDKQGKGNE